MDPDEEPAAAVDADALKAAERDGWQNKSGAWNRWADHIAELAERLNAPLLDAADLDGDVYRIAAHARIGTGIAGG